MAGVALSSGPALALASIPGLVDQPQDPVAVIAPGTTGTVTFGLKNTTGEDFTSDGKDAAGNGLLRITVGAPQGTTLADKTLTQVVGAPGPAWDCSQYSDSTHLDCIADFKGVVLAAGQTTQWRVNITVPSGVPNDALAESLAYFQYYCGDQTPPPMSVKVATGDTAAQEPPPCPPA
ncbi:hypothetical protein [Streptomyces sp. BPTC-684]|uniref:hypothetical protein n=1 Tax=Streptomyces sp. BPTC-684 TaxID=3043734 RepID=UPI0024B07746|nr:hypothetical protein [Streptomyces sp. BPTC-684]WHM40992.1 hypothetical protein QIY60_31740 [Streptomyces sp. BPTC-684]